MLSERQDNEQPTDPDRGREPTVHPWMVPPRRAITALAFLGHCRSVEFPGMFPGEGVSGWRDGRALTKPEKLASAAACDMFTGYFSGHYELDVLDVLEPDPDTPPRQPQEPGQLPSAAATPEPGQEPTTGQQAATVGEFVMQHAAAHLRRGQFVQFTAIGGQDAEGKFQPGLVCNTCNASRSLPIAEVTP